jgi:CheY-like chemotaxis protein
MESEPMELEPVTILLVEDDPGDQKLIKTSLKDQRIANDLYIVDSAEEALDFLHHRGSYSHRTPRPDLILLDLNMPGMGGKEFLKEVKNHDYLKVIPVNVLTTSDSDRDILDSYKLHANGYLKKPVDLPELKEVIKKIGEYWFVICKRPPKEPSR